MYEEISRAITHYLETAPAFQDWPMSQALLLERLARDQPWIHALPVLTCQAVGGKPSQAIPVAAAWIVLVHSANLINDIQDGDLDSIGHSLQPDQTLAIAIGWIFAAFGILDHSSMSSKVRARITGLFASAGFDSSIGRFLEISADAREKESGDPLLSYWRSVILKSGSICLAGAAAGAVVATVSERLIEAAGDFGRALGIIWQVMDDCRDIGEDEKDQNRVTLPSILDSMIASTSHDPESYSRVQRGDGGEPSQREAFDGFIDKGIPEVITDILLDWRRRALESLSLLPVSEARSNLENILTVVLTPKQIPA